MKSLGTLEKTNRGFEIINFRDCYGKECSIQQSSLAHYEKPGTSAIWLGISNPEPKILHGDAKKFGIVTSETSGWVPYPIPEEVLLCTRMHLDRDQVKALISNLKSWLKKDTFQNE